MQLEYLNIYTNKYIYKKNGLWNVSLYSQIQYSLQSWGYSEFTEDDEKSNNKRMNK